MRNERPTDILERFSHEGSPTTSYDVCENSVTQSDLPRCSMPTFLARGEAEGETPKEELLVTISKNMNLSLKDSKSI